MYTQCPHCAVRFALSAEQLLQAGGRVCCGHCEHEFNALERLRLPEEGGEPPRLGGSELPTQGELFVVEPVAAELPRFAHPVGVIHTHRGHWGAAALALGILLGLQIVIAQRDELAQDRHWRPLLEAVCGRLGCSLPAWRETAAWRLSAREIGPHPSSDDALLVTATLVNQAEFAQPLPQLELTLSNLDGRAIALRRFLPREYAGPDLADHRLAPGQSLSARLELVDPGKDALAFAFEFK